MTPDVQTKMAVKVPGPGSAGASVHLKVNSGVSE